MTRRAFSELYTRCERSGFMVPYAEVKKEPVSGQYVWEKFLLKHALPNPPLPAEPPAPEGYRAPLPDVPYPVGYDLAAVAARNMRGG
jgi:hypothetical protein